VITQDIEDLWVDPNATAVFDVVFLSNLSPTVRWYKYVDGVSDILLSSGGRYQITTENTGGSNYLSTLEISTIEVSDEGSYYCMLSTND